MKLKSTSHYQQIIESKLNYFLDDEQIETIEIDQYYHWLINPRTKKQLQLDFLIIFKDKISVNCKDDPMQYRNVKLAIEVQGEQHYKFDRNFHKNKQAFKSQLYRDDIKFSILRDMGIPLIRIKYNKCNYKLNIKQLILGTLNRINDLPKHSNYGNQNKNRLIELFTEMQFPIEYDSAQIDHNRLFEINEYVKFLKCD